MLFFARRNSAVLLVLSLLLAGCGGEDRVDTVPVSGVVTYDGQPVVGAEVVFQNDLAPRAAVGTTDAEGKFQLQTYEDFDGAVPGDHVITITKAQANAAISGADAEDPSAAYAEGMNAAMSGDMSAISKNELPEKYASPVSSGLNETVTEQGPNNFEFNLE